MKNRKLSLIAGIIVLCISIIACTMNVGGPTYPAPAIPISTEAVGNLLTSMETAAAEGLVSGTTTMVITEVQITSYLAYKLQSQTNPFITDPQVYLRNGEIQIFGTAKRGNVLMTMAAFVSAGVDSQGQLQIVLKSADVGPLPAPESIKKAITASIQEAYTGAVGPAATGFRLESVTIADGTMTIVGRSK